MRHVVEDVRHAARRLLRVPAFTFAATVTMAVGIGAVATGFALVYGVLLRPLPYPDADRLVAIDHMATGLELTRDGLSAGMYLHYRDRNRVFDEIAGYTQYSFTFTDVNRPERVQIAMVTPELFSVLQVTPSMGRVPTAADDTHDVAALSGTMGAMISHDLWVERYAADPDVLGRRLEIDGHEWAVVTGVAQEGFAFPDPSVKAWLATAQERLSWSERAEVRRAMSLEGVARLRPGVTLEDAAADLDRLVALLPDVFPDVTSEELDAFGLRARVVPFKEAIVGDVGLTLLLVLGSAGFLLLVTWASVCNLVLMRTHGRRAEIAITRALGADERAVAGRLLSESLLLAATAGVVGLGLAAAVIETRLGFTPNELPRLAEVEVDMMVVGAVTALALASGTLMGLLCLVGARKGADGTALSGLRSRSATEYREAHTGRSALVTLQVALALSLLVGSSLMARSLWQLQEADLGFRSEGRLTFYMPITHLGLDTDHHEYAALHAAVMGNLRSLPGVESVEAATASVFPLTVAELGHEDLMAIHAVGAPVADGDSPLAEYGYATPGYFREMGIPLLSGRTFQNDDAAPSAPGAILSVSLARELFPEGRAVGGTVVFPDSPSSWPAHTVVGVVGDVPATTVREGGSRAIYLPNVHPLPPDVSRETLYPHVPRFERYVVRASTDLAALAPALRRAVHEIDPRLPMLDMAPLSEVVSEATSQERFMLRLLLLSAATALFLGVVGIYGVLAYSVRRRIPEMGIRLALGASPARVTSLVVGQGAALSLMGIILGLAGSFGLTRVLESLLYETDPTDPLMFAASSLFLFGVTLVASYVPAKRASNVDPAHALRAE